MKKLSIQRNSGFSTLLVVIILGGVALSTTLMLSTSSVWSIRGSIDSKNSTIATSLVNSCVEVALEAIRESNSYAGTSTVLLGGNTCTYIVSNTGGSTRHIVATGTVQDVVRKLNVTTSALNPHTISLWQEIP